MSTDYEAEVKRGVCALLDAETFLRWIDPEEEPLGVYDPAEMGLTIGILPDADQAVMVNTYTVQTRPDPIVGLQFHVAAMDEDLVTAACQAIGDVLDGRWGGNLGTVRLVDASHQSSGLLGQDANGRRGRTENYYLRIARAVPNREGE